ncbi:MAG: tetratricopeptide repeat protein [Methylococcales bacterium]|nr:tetratricopeptide repeat protein [Methylococcales bacterium]
MIRFKPLRIFCLVVLLWLSACARHEAPPPILKPQPVVSEPHAQPKTSIPKPEIVVQPDRDPAQPPPDWARSDNRVAPEPMLAAADALLAQGQRHQQMGRLEQAVATLERGLRIAPRNAALLLALAEVRFAQGNYPLAEQLARKAELLAANNIEVKQASRRLIDKAHLKAD